MKLFFLALLLFFKSANADIPAYFHPLVVKPPFNFSERLMDLTPALDKAQRLNQPILVYLGAADCPPCKNYTAFLEAHQESMKPALADVVLVDIRTWLRGPKIVFQMHGQRFTVNEFKAHVGDDRKGLFYPYWWLLNPQGQQIRPLPHDTRLFTSVESHVRLIKGP